MLYLVPWWPFDAKCSKLSQDMIELLGKRPFEGRSDDMDKYLDKQGEKNAPPPFEAPVPAPSVASKKIEVR